MTVPRDYKNRAQKKPPRKPLPAWLWLITGLLLGGFVVGLVWLNGQSDRGGGEWVGARPDRPPQGGQEATSRAEPPARPKPRFDFYETLPRMEVEVPGGRQAETRPPERSKQAGSAVYHLQIGAFKRAADADRLKAQLTLLGLDVKVSRARLANNDTRYRVRSGPYRSTTEVNQARRRLAENGFDGLILKID